MNQSPTTPPRALTSTLACVTEWSERIHLFCEQADSSAPEAVSHLFSDLIRAAFCRRHPQDHVAAHTAFLAMLKGCWSLEKRCRVREAAVAENDEIVLTFLSIEPWPEDDSRDFAIPQYSKERPLTLGERRSLATSPHRRWLVTALRDPSPLVGLRLLGNPRLTESDGLLIASRNPAPKRLLCEMAVHPRWRVKHRVALALVRNPSLLPSFALSMLPFLPAPEVADISRDLRLADEVRNAARLLLFLKKNCNKTE